MATFTLTVVLLFAGMALLVVALMASANRVGARGFVLAGAVCVGLAAWGVSDMARAQSGAHGDGHVQQHDWYSGLQRPNGEGSCCNGKIDGIDGDCRPTRAYYGDDGIWYAMIDGLWVPVPPRVVLDVTHNPQWGSAHICASITGTIHCFLGKRAGG